MKRMVHRLLRPLGYDIVQFPHETIRVHLERVLERWRINCVLDVGAQHGSYARLVRDLPYRGTIVSFEPIQGSFDVLAQAAAEDPGWHVHRLALGDRSGQQPINVARRSDFSSFLEPSDYALDHFPDSHVVANETVEVRRLDDIFDQVVPVNEPRVLLKIDTQGWDLEVMRGASESLRSIEAVQMEMSAKALYERAPSYVEAISYLTDLGFQLSGFFPIARDDDLRVIEFDCVMLRAGERR